MNHQALIELLQRQNPVTEEHARVCVEDVILLAMEEQLEVQLRDEGEATPEGLYIYPITRRSSIGASYREGRNIWGWRWSTWQQRCCRQDTDEFEEKWARLRLNIADDGTVTHTYEEFLGRPPEIPS